MKELVGKTVKELYVNEDQSLLKFVTDQGEVIYQTEADCCSETWFADIIFGHKFFCSYDGIRVNSFIGHFVSPIIIKLANL